MTQSRITLRIDALPFNFSFLLLFPSFVLSAPSVTVVPRPELPRRIFQQELGKTSLSPHTGTNYPLRILRVP